MANEVTVVEMIGLRADIPVPVMPPLAVQTLSIGGAVSAAFSKSAQIVRIMTTTACSIEFSTAANVDPTGAGMKFPIPAGVPQDFSVRPGTRVIAVA